MILVTPEGAIQALRATIGAITGFADDLVRIAWGNVGRPDVDHFLVTVLADNGIGIPQRTTAGVLVHHRQLQVQIDAFGEAVIGAGACSALDTFVSCCMSDAAAMRTMYRCGVSVQNVGSTQDLTGLYRDTYEPRRTVTLLLGYARSVAQQEPGPVTSVSVDLEAEGGVTASDAAVITVTP